MHNRLEQTGPTSAACSEQNAQDETCLGGWARIATAVKEARRRAAAEKAGFLFLVSIQAFRGAVCLPAAVQAAAEQLRPMYQRFAHTKHAWQDIGDEFDGTLWDVVYKGQATAQVQNMVQPDAMVRPKSRCRLTVGILISTTAARTRA